MERIRAFIAIELPEAVRTEITHIQDQIKVKSKIHIRWVKPSNIHLTLKFLGDINSNQVEDIIKAIGDASPGFGSFRLGINGLGVFPNTNRVQVIWVGLSGNLDKLGKLQRNIDIALGRLGFPAEKRPFSPHLTLGRMSDHAKPVERQSTGRLIASMDFRSRLDFPVTSVYLIKSQLTREGPIYSRLGSGVLS
jgi:2'-5' RNA ligase